MHIAHSNIKKGKKSDRRESAMIWMMRQIAADKRAALKKFADRIAKIREHYPEF